MAAKETSMRRSQRKRLTRGTLAGIAGGLAASWVMNLFISKLGEKLTQSLMSDEDNQQQQQQSAQQQEPKEDATMKAAEGIVHTVTRGQHLLHEERKQAGPVVHYAFGALAGGLYGALAECSHWTSLGFGTVFGALLYASADLIGVPSFDLAPSPTEQSIAAQATPLAAHLVYGATTDLVRRAIRAAA
jgi:putative membrane protein